MCVWGLCVCVCVACVPACVCGQKQTFGHRRPVGTCALSHYTIQVGHEPSPTVLLLGAVSKCSKFGDTQMSKGLDFLLLSLLKC